MFSYKESRMREGISISGGGDRRATKGQYDFVIFFVLVFFVLVLAVVVLMNVKNTMNLRDILAESVKSQLLSVSMAAREIVDVDDFMKYDNADVAALPEYQATLSRLRLLCDSVGAKYIYALKMQRGEAVFVFDTDSENEEIFISYDISPVHEAAFMGRNAADIMNVKDEYGSFNTGAVPIWNNGKVAGIICTDIKDEYMESSLATAYYNSAILVCMLAVTMLVTFYIVLQLLKRLKAMQQKLQRQALYDHVTDLPNRQYLMDHLAKLTSAKTRKPFALFFIDLDNFKTVNDNAGHDAGDALLRHIAQYLDGALENTKSFRPTAGQLNIAARVGGDEFIQVVHGVETEEKAREIAIRLLGNFKNQYLDRFIEKYAVGLSVGVALYPYHSDNYHVIIKYADMAMYAAKQAGKNQYRLYSDELNRAVPADGGTNTERE